MVEDPNELRNLVNDPSLEKVRSELLNEHLGRLLSHLDEGKLKVFEERESLPGGRSARRTSRDSAPR